MKKLTRNILIFTGIAICLLIMMQIKFQRKVKPNHDNKDFEENINNGSHKKYHKDPHEVKIDPEKKPGKIEKPPPPKIDVEIPNQGTINTTIHHDKHEFEGKLKGDYEGGIVIMVGWRPKILKEVLTSLGHIRDKGKFVLVSSHDLIDEESVQLVEEFSHSTESFYRTFQVVNVYRTVYTSLIKHDKKDKSYFTKALKIHWLFAMHFAFEVLGLEHVIYLEDDVIFSPDLLIAHRELLKYRDTLCDNCFFNLGCHRDCWGTKADDFEKVVLFPGPGNIGTVIFKEHYFAIKDNLYDYCASVEDNWDINLKHFVSKKILPPKSLTYSLSRTQHMNLMGSIRGGKKQKTDTKKSPSEERESIEKRYSSLGLNVKKVDLSSKKKNKLRRVGPVFEKKKPMKVCRRKYTDICMMAGKDEFEISEVIIKGDFSRVVLSEIDFQNRQIDVSKDHCWS